MSLEVSKADVSPAGLRAVPGCVRNRTAAVSLLSSQLSLFPGARIGVRPIASRQRRSQWSTGRPSNRRRPGHARGSSSCTQGRMDHVCSGMDSAMVSKAIGCNDLSRESHE